MAGAELPTGGVKIVSVRSSSVATICIVHILGKHASSHSFKVIEVAGKQFPCQVYKKLSF